MRYKKDWHCLENAPRSEFCLSSDDELVGIRFGVARFDNGLL